MNAPRRHLLWAVLALVATGCTSITSQQRAQTLGRGKFEFSLEPGVLAGVSTSTAGAWGAAPRADLAGHFGISDNVDLGFRLGSVGLEFMTNFQLTHRASKVHVSLAPSINGVYLFLGGTSGAGGGLAGFQLPVLIGIETGNDSEIVIGPRVVDQLIIGGGGTGSGLFNTVLLGGSLGYSIKITDHFRLFPEVSVVAPVLSTSASGGSAITTGGFVFNGLIVQGTLGFQFGN